MAAWRAFLEAHAAVTRELDAELREERDLPLTWYDALVQLHEAGGELRMSDLAGRLLLSRSATTRFAQRLETAGLVVRTVARSDRRGRTVTITPLGVEKLRAAAVVHLHGIATHFACHIDGNEAGLLAEILGRMSRGGGRLRRGGGAAGRREFFFGGLDPGSETEA